MATPRKEVHLNRLGLKRMHTGGLITTVRGSIGLTPRGQTILDEMMDPRNIIVKRLPGSIWIGICH